MVICAGVSSKNNILLNIYVYDSVNLYFLDFIAHLSMERVLIVIFVANAESGCFLVFGQLSSAGKTLFAYKVKSVK